MTSPWTSKVVTEVIQRPSWIALSVKYILPWIVHEKMFLQLAVAPAPALLRHCQNEGRGTPTTCGITVKDCSCGVTSPVAMGDEASVVGMQLQPLPIGCKH